MQFLHTGGRLKSQRQARLLPVAEIRPHCSQKTHYCSALSKFDTSPRPKSGVRPQAELYSDFTSRQDTNLTALCFGNVEIMCEEVLIEIFMRRAYVMEQMSREVCLFLQHIPCRPDLLLLLLKGALKMGRRRLLKISPLEGAERRSPRLLG